ncbi:MAG: hypothetical protein CVV44_03910 [Spirochaetae bacterium HGW-Spirochaetae-1]|jgi:hypothetical protein|nr:MAG: hypothetical protein CVV44_03910 [Spirochaetae bacterium HGW-Spirochaetae-1]
MGILNSNQIFAFFKNCFLWLFGNRRSFVDNKTLEYYGEKTGEALVGGYRESGRTDVERLSSFEVGLGRALKRLTKKQK